MLSPNKYNVLVELKADKPKVKKTVLNRSTHVKILNKDPIHSHLLKELTKISSRDYIGKDLCRSCVKEVKNNQQAIHCDTCERWIHRSCSDMNSKTYKLLMCKKNFIWTCNKCRQDDPVNNNKADVSKLARKEQPEKLEEIKKTSKEMLIIHMNCRSILNKEEELKNIVEGLDPDIITLSETWLGDHIPSQTCIPEGYKVIRKDRSDGFKQRYG